MKNTFILSLFSITLSAFSAQSSERVQDFTETAPEMVARQKANASDQEAELTLLKQGITFFSRNHFDKALSCFQKALGDYGSPLGYLYAASLEEDDNTANRYFNISLNASKYGAVAAETLTKHNEWINNFFDTLDTPNTL